MICGFLMSDARRSCTAVQCSDYAEPPSATGEVSQTLSVTAGLSAAQGAGGLHRHADGVCAAALAGGHAHSPGWRVAGRLPGSPLAPIDLMDLYSMQLSRQLLRAYNIFVKGGNGR